ncbi:Gpi16 subunit, GPI transamidase domain-containing protein, putative [Eimeria tenella]|uniref:Gpi16 subunit, GPI transamidase domain-containing protein, putative n=1 Tax=Eimeria tenella TaxID=5802 RepID=U6KYU0_EIMTE|nr:Gpi16 subunit, GPI transamidase domain-containing protein, putative [Eimeria tenella]CDJ42098.1 Gpi16 subunit, GPI transamidase domain-containing protein, putative [Eimeria tenella]|eukprot:XP_013232848.1 Gpi16 subunit, GPI transamidase domain-containing protein, putative [Eimeria tenella]
MSRAAAAAAAAAAVAAARQPEKCRRQRAAPSWEVFLLLLCCCCCLSLLQATDAAAATPATAQAAAEPAPEVYSEVVFTEPLRSRGLFLAHFDLRLRSSIPDGAYSGSGLHAHMFPLDLARLLGTHLLQQDSNSLRQQQKQELPHAYSFIDLSLTQGRWKANLWGPAAAAAKPPGAFLRAGLSQHPSYHQQRLWSRLTHTLASTTCSALSRLASATDAVVTQTSAAAAAAATDQGEEQQQPQGYAQRMASLPEAAICSDTHNNMLRLLPCKQQAGLLMVLHPYSLAISPYKSYRLRITPFAAQQRQQQQQVAELRLELSVVLRYPDEADLKFSLVNLFSQVYLHVFPKPFEQKADEQQQQQHEEQQKESLLAQNPPAFGRWNCVAAGSSKWLLRIFHETDSNSSSSSEDNSSRANELVQQVASAAGFATYDAFAVDASSSLIVFDLRQQQQQPQQEQQEQQQLESLLSYRWRLPAEAPGFSVSRGLVANAIRPEADKLHGRFRVKGSYWVVFENSGDSAASAAFVDLLPRSVLPLVAAAKLVRYPVYQETQQDYQLEQQQQQDCDLSLEGSAAVNASGLKLQSPVTSGPTAEVAAVGRSALAADITAAVAAGGAPRGGMDDTWLPHWLRVRSSLLPEGSAAAEKQQEGAQLMLPSAVLRGTVRVPARCSMLLSLGLQLMLQQPQLLHSNPQGGSVVGGAFAAVPRKLAFAWPPPAAVLGSAANACAVKQSPPCSIRPLPAGAGAAAENQVQQAPLEPFLGFKEDLEERQWQWTATGGTRLKLPLPDFDMPFNVIAVSGTSLMILFSATFRLVVHRR